MGGKLAACFGILLIIGMPIGFTLLGVSLFFFIFTEGIPMETLIQRVISGTQSFPLLAIPLFILTGELMNQSGITKRIMDFAHALTGHLTGGLAQVNVIASTMMSGLGGSANADAAMTSRLLVPQMVQRGYSVGFAAALTAASSLIAPMIPPSIGLIIYGFVTNTSINKLFIGGIVPGLLMGATLMITVYLISKKRGYVGESKERPSLKVVVSLGMKALPAFLLPLIIIVGIRFGVFTTSEAAGVAALVALLVGIFAYRELTWAGFIESIRSTTIVTSAIMLILAASSAFSWVLGYEKIPQAFAEGLLGVSSNTHVTLFLIFVFLMIVGLFLEGTAAIILLGPMFLPVINQLGIDPIHFGVAMVLTLTIGGITPPVGTIMYTTCLVTGVNVSKFTREIIPFLVTLIIVNLIVFFIPETVTFLVNLIGD